MAYTSPYAIMYPTYDDLVKSTTSASALADDFRDLAGSVNNVITTVKGQVDASFQDVNAYIQQLITPNTEISNLKNRVFALETLGGISPGSTTDATMTNVALNSSSTFFEALRYRIDTAANTKTVFEIDHYGAGTDHAYGIDIQNFPGAASALVLHQYSSAGNGAFVLDNTGSAPAFRIDNTENTSINPGSVGSGPFFRLSPWNNHESSRMDLRDDLMWDNATKYGHGVINWISGVGFTVDQKIAAIGLHVKQASTFYGIRVDAVDYAGYFTASGTGGQAVTVERTGASGTAMRINNTGTGWNIYSTGNAGVSWTVAGNGQQRIYTAGVGIILRAPNGNSYELTVSNTGTAVFTSVA